MSKAVPVYLVGETGVGKHTLISTYQSITNRYPDCPIQLDQISMNVNNHFIGQIPPNFSSAKIILLCVDLTDDNDTDTILEKLESIYQFNNTAFIILVGNKKEDDEIEIEHLAEIMRQDLCGRYPKLIGVVELNVKDPNEVKNFFEEKIPAFQQQVLLSPNHVATSLLTNDYGSRKVYKQFFTSGTLVGGTCGLFLGPAITLGLLILAAGIAMPASVAIGVTALCMAVVAGIVLGALSGAIIGKNCDLMADPEYSHPHLD